MIETIKQWLEAIQNYPSLKNENLNLLLDNEKLQREIANLKLNIMEIKQTPVQKENFKLPNSTNIYYSAPKKKLLKDYLKNEGDQNLKKIASEIIKNDISMFDDCDHIIRCCQKWLDDQFKEKRFSYKTDQVTHQVREYWQTVEETLETNAGDCDDYMILMYNLIREIFIQLGGWEKVKDRLYCVNGGVNQRGLLPDPAEVHAYLVWRADDEEFYSVETTFFRSTAIANFEKLPHRNDMMRNYMRYIWNEEKMYYVHAFRNLEE